MSESLVRASTSVKDASTEPDERPAIKVEFIDCLDTSDWPALVKYDLIARRAYQCRAAFACFRLLHIVDHPWTRTAQRSITTVDLRGNPHSPGELHYMLRSAVVFDRILRDDDAKWNNPWVGSYLR